MIDFFGAFLGGMFAYGSILGISWIMLKRRDKRAQKRLEAKLAEFFKSLPAEQPKSLEVKLPAPGGPAN